MVSLPPNSTNCFIENKLFFKIGTCKTLVTHPKLLDRFNYESKGENNIRIRNWGTFPDL